MYVHTPKHGRKKQFFRQEYNSSNEHESLANDATDELSQPLEHEPAQPLEHEYEYGPPRKQHVRKLKHKRIRRGGLKHKDNKNVKFSLLGNNSAGIKAKQDSLEAVIKLLGNPSCITLQETKLVKKNVFHLNGYQVFQKNRNGSGGGLLTAVDPSLNPMLISTNNEEAEILTVQKEVNKMNIRLINGYGPQDDDSLQNRLNFWLGLDQEILSAKSESCLVMVQMDANGKVGRNIISADPNNVTDGNGRQMLDIIERHGLRMLNSNKMCSGAVTRYRVTKNGTEMAILDYFLVCQELYEFFENMVILSK